MMITKRLSLILLCLFALNVYSQDHEKTILKTFHSISSHDLLNDAAELTLPKYGGRLSGSPGYQAAAQWVADQLKQAGVKPGLNDGSYLQYFPNAYSDVLTPGSVTLLAGKNNAKKDYKFPDDYFPGSNSATGTVFGEIVYVGFGISAPELGYDDYKDIDIKGKILLMETGVPYTGNDSILQKWEKYSYHRYKFQRAKELGAAGLLYVGKVANPNTSYLEGFVYAHISEQVAEELLDGTNKKYAELSSAIKKSLQPNSFTLNKKVQISAKTKHFPDSRSCNVVGIIEGSDPKLKAEAIILGAHLDAVGSPGCLFPGALDNGSGSVDILAAARALAASEVKPARTVIFVFFGGEECGLYGSKKCVESPVWPKEKVLCMINLDMVGNGTGFHLSNGKSYPDLFRPFAEKNKKYLHRELNSSEYRINYGRPRTDAAVFDKAGYRTLSLWTSGTVKTVYYHHPLDNTDALTPEIMEDAAKLLYLGILDLASDETISAR
ncbi:MAG: M20/M25/M40 family metallo-hydrolase [Prolixibacteraceae bacterium]|nr:M20/M25/M40 family metallo-hydrolase [Prolixibacteraceae bacterium]